MKKLLLFIIFLVGNMTLGHAQISKPVSIGKTFSSVNAGESAIIYIQKANVFLAKFDTQRALLEYNNAIAIYPDDATAYVYRADLLRRVGRLTEAEADIEMSRRLNPYAVEILGLAGPTAQLSFLAYLPSPVSDKTNIELEQALAKYQEVTTKNEHENIENKIRRAIIHRNLGNYTDAQILLDDVLGIAPNHPIALINRGDLYLKDKHYANAIITYTEAIYQDGDFAEAYYNRGIANILHLDPVSGCADLEKSRELGFYSANEIEKYFCVY